MAKAEKKERSKREQLRHLIRNYNRIRDKCDQTILDRIESEAQNRYSLEWYTDLMEGRDPDFWADGLRATSHHTEELIMALDFAVFIYRNIAIEECRQGDFRSWRQYDALYSKYFSANYGSVWEIALKYGVSKPVIYEDLRIAENRFISMILGEKEF